MISIKKITKISTISDFYSYYNGNQYSNIVIKKTKRFLSFALRIFFNNLFPTGHLPIISVPSADQNGIESLLNVVRTEISKHLKGNNRWQSSIFSIRKNLLMNILAPNPFIADSLSAIIKLTLWLLTTQLFINSPSFIITWIMKDYNICSMTNVYIRHRIFYKLWIFYTYMNTYKIVIIKWLPEWWRIIRAIAKVIIWLTDAKSAVRVRLRENQ